MSKTVTVLDELSIQRGVSRMGDKIIRLAGDAKSISLVCVMNAAFQFFTDIVRYVESHSHVPIECLFIYKGLPRPEPSGDVMFIIDTLGDTGETVNQINKLYIDTMNTMIKIHFITLLQKEHFKVDSNISVSSAYVAPNAFLLGYGLDDGTEFYRSKPYIRMFCDTLKDDE